MSSPDNPDANLSLFLEAFEYHYPTLPLLQSGELARAAYIPQPEHMDISQLEALRVMGFAATQTFSLAAIAGTQYEEHVFDFFGTDRCFNNTIYFSPTSPAGFAPKFGNKTLQGALFINPVLRVHPLNRWALRIEGCGSIDKCRLKMVDLRPTLVTFSAYVYAPDKGFSRPQWVELLNTDDSAAIAHHEMDHLYGLDATNSPNTRIVNLFALDDPVFEGPYAHETVRLKDFMRRLGEDAQWLVPDGNRLIVTDMYGEYIGDYTRKYPR